jgi:hypothetical protein
MSSNLAVINFSVGGTLTVSGKITLAETVLSSSSVDIQGITTTSLNTTGTSTFTKLPTSSQTPTLDNQLTTKVYVDTADGVVNKRITDTVSAQKKYIDDADTVLDNRITTVDNSRKTYIDNGDKALDTKIDSYGKKGYYIQFGNKTYLGSDFGFSQFIELRPSTGQFTFYTTFLPNPTTCAGQIVSIWNNTIEDQGVDQTGDNLFIRNVENKVAIFIKSKTTEMFVSSGNNWINFKGPVLQD